jgi:glycosyltransferase involved in cell wall biosynthesis
MTPLVSVVVPTCDRPSLLAVTLRGIVRQHVRALEIVVVDDGVGMQSAEVVGALEDTRVRLVPNIGPRGVGNARNTGLALARGPWIAFCDDDDLWAPEKLEAQLAAAEKAHAEWAYAGCVHVDDALNVLFGTPPPTPDDVVRDLTRYNAVPGSASSVLVRTETLARAGLFTPDLAMSEDWDLWLRIANVAGPPACAFAPLVALRQHRGMMSRRGGQEILAAVEIIARRHNIAFDRARHERWVAWMALEDGKRLESAGRYAKVALRGDWRSVGRALVALASPGTARRLVGEAACDPWAHGASAWLAALREGSAADSGRGYDVDMRPRSDV